ncbi:hemin uptake protein hemP [Citrobacter amalonaticus]|uniref:Hemin uptake protein hemP n=1 Tax=Citrobacter amalonaticus TaxID=35703 RepID=A0A2S4RYW6_CITAM|nr:hemin uptake protein HemP [Citrobacter amalonaticus]POT57573.1 hemin uptake protein hemP [Citrobacter amalonaticus]POT76900.1 hemin uptake protein hemP [Citrobacter amalonaticus]POU65979.1 hemin uptake protein hemP [Citrobacter amalonaticus]POV06136.1 hemin uptake protein hemP [Citrobacter amalonaticus]
MPRRDNTGSLQPKEREKIAPPPDITRRISSQTLLGQEGKVIIDHDGQQYLLRKTQAGKLLLTK